MRESPQVRAILERVERLLIEDPDPDRYDYVWNKAIRCAVLAIIEAIETPTRTMHRIPYSRTPEDV